MQIVIDISEEEYERIKKMAHYCRTYSQDMIVNGTPLPKGHGELIDELKKEADALGYKLVKKPCYDCTCVTTYPRVEKCKDYEPIELESPKRINSHLTHCRRKSK